MRALTSQLLLASLVAVALGGCRADGDPASRRVALAVTSSPVTAAASWTSGPTWPNEVCTALNSIALGASSRATGDVAVISASPGPTLTTGYELALGASSMITGNVRADSLSVGAAAKVTGNAAYNTVSLQGTIGGTRTTTLSLPLPITVPAFPSFTAGTTAIDLATRGKQTLAAGSYGLVKLRAGAANDATILTLSGGNYQFANLEFSANSRVECSAPCEIRIKDRVASAASSYLGPSTASNLDLKDVRLFIEGSNGGTGQPGTQPPLSLGASSTLRAFVFIPNGTLEFGASTTASGRFIARDIALGASAQLTAAGTTVLAPAIVTQPQALSVQVGSAATFSVSATGTALSYQWQRDQVAIAGATAASYTLATTTLADDGRRFRVVVSNSSASVTSAEVTLTVTAAAPAITQHPANVNALEGSAASFTCAASGTAPAYQWQKNASDIAGATSATFSLPAVTLNDAGSYRCKATNAAGSATSNAAQLTVLLRPPVITQNPANTVATEGLRATLQCSASGSQVSYRWQKDALDLTGATSASLILDPVRYEDRGAYRCIASNSGGSVTSTAATLSVNLQPPLIIVQPDDASATENQPVTLSCFASGTNILYRWLKGSGAGSQVATGATLQFAHVQATDAGNYRCEASNTGGTSQSRTAILSVLLLPPSITQQPAAVRVTEGQAASFSCAASGTNVSYQWQKDGADLAGATSASFAIAAAAPSHAGQYRCIAKNSGGSATSNAAALSIDLIAPAITAQPQNATVTEGQAAHFSCAASGTNVSYRWQKAAQDIAGATSASFDIAHTRLEDEGAYRCIARNSGGEATSNAATLVVRLLAPTITQQPPDTSVAEGSSATLTCAASGTNVSYVWLKGSGGIEVGAGPTLTIASAAYADQASYRCKATNSAGSATSNPAALTVQLKPPVITQHPASTSATEGTPASFSCAASGTNVSYRWQKNGADIAGATAASYNLPAVAVTHAGDYRCIAQNSGGTAQSNPATLSVLLNAPVFTTQPHDSSTLEGQTASFTCAASGSLVSYQWQKDEANIEGATAARLDLDDVEYADQGAYRCIAHNSGGDVYSNAATLQVRLLAPVITQQPSSTSVTEGQSASFTCAARGTNVSYVWLKGTAAIEVGSGPTLSVAAASYADQASFRCKASNSGGSVQSNPVTLTVALNRPVLVQQPASLSATEGQSASFTCAAAGTNLSYRWQKNGQDIPGATSATFSLAAVAYADAGNYRCIAQNTGGSAQSDPASLSILLRPPTITTQPHDSSTLEGQSAHFTCAASGTLVSYKWQHDGHDLEAATSATLDLGAVQHDDAGAYRCIAHNSGGEATSNAATLSVRLITPVITLQPSDTSVAEGGDTSLRCAASGTLVTYRWLKGAAGLEVGTEPTLPIHAAIYADQDSYRCVASNNGGDAQSRAAQLSVQLTAPVITQHPSQVTATEGDSASFSCAASGTNVSYRWQKDASDIPGANLATYTRSPLEYSDAGSYRCIAQNTGGSAQSNPATLAVSLLPPTITTQPSEQTAIEHKPVHFTCAASGSLIGYQWQKDGQDIPGATAATLTIASAGDADEGSYRCVVSNSGGSVASEPAPLHVSLLAPVITQQPQTQSVTEGDAVHFTCVASGTHVGYRWLRDGTTEVGTSASLDIAQARYEDGGSYHCEASNSGGQATSHPASLTVLLLPPKITQQPEPATAKERQAATFTCAASGTQISYQWQKAGQDIPGAHQATFTLPEVTYDDRGDYRCAVRNSGGVAQSQVATLTVTLLPPVFTQQPQNTEVTEGQPASLACAASGTLVTYQWQKAGSNVATATSATYTIDPTAPDDAAEYRCVASNSGGQVTSDPATLQVKLLPPIITRDPVAVTVAEGQSFNLSVQASGSQLSYQWQRNGIDVEGANASSYQRAATLSDDGASYRAVVRNSGGSAQSAAASVHLIDDVRPTLNLSGPPQVTLTDDRIQIRGTATDNASGPLQTNITSSQFPGQQFAAILNPDGSFQSEMPLQLGQNVITVTVRDQNGNTTTQTITVTVEVAATPRILIAEPTPGSTVQTDRIRVRGIVRSSLPAEQLRLSLGDNVQYPTGSGPEYSFEFAQVPLVPGSNRLTIVAQTPTGTVQQELVVTRQGSSTQPVPVPPRISLQVAETDVYITQDSFVVAGSVIAQRCVSSVRVNGASAHVTGGGTQVSFDRTLSFSALGSSDVPVEVQATDCDGLIASAYYQAHRDDGPPTIIIDNLQLAPQVNAVTDTPYRLRGKVSELNLAGLTVAGQSISVLPTGSGSWDFAIDVPLARQTDRTLQLEAWDRAGHRASASVTLRLGSTLELEVLSPVAGSSMQVSGDSAQLAVMARANGMADSDRVSASIDNLAPQLLTRIGNLAQGNLSFAASDGHHSIQVRVLSDSGAVLASQSVGIDLVREESLLAAVIAQDPAPDTVDIEANTPITLRFNKALDPMKLQVAVLETAHGKIYSEPPLGADILSQGQVELVDVHREREAVPGQTTNYPGNRMVTFYPARDYGYGGEVQLEVTYDNAPLWHARFSIRRLPTLVHGFVADHLRIPLANISVELPEVGRTVVTDLEGNYSIGFGEPAAAMLAPGRYRALFNPRLADPRYGTTEGYIEVNAEQINTAGVTLITRLNDSEPFRSLQSRAATPVAFAQGDLLLDVSAADLGFEAGQAQGNLHAQFATPNQTGLRFLASAYAEFGYVLNPCGVQASGQIEVQMRLPSREGSFAWIEDLPDKVLFVGVDPSTLMVEPIGVGQVDKAARTVSSTGRMHLRRLDYIGVATAGLADHATLLQQYAAGNISLAQLTSTLESGR